MVSFNFNVDQPRPIGFSRPTTSSGSQKGQVLFGSQDRVTFGNTATEIKTPAQLYKALNSFSSIQKPEEKELLLERIITFLKTDAGQNVPTHLKKNPFDYPVLIFDEVPNVHILIGIQSQNVRKDKREYFPMLTIYDKKTTAPVYDSQHQINDFVPVGPFSGEIEDVGSRVLTNAAAFEAYAKSLLNSLVFAPTHMLGEK